MIRLPLRWLVCSCLLVGCTRKNVQPATSAPPKAEVTGAFGFKLGDRLPDRYTVERSEVNYELRWDFPPDYRCLGVVETTVEPQFLSVTTNRIIYRIEGWGRDARHVNKYRLMISYFTEKYGKPEGNTRGSTVHAQFGGTEDGTNRFVLVTGSEETFFITYTDPVLKRQANLEAETAKAKAKATKKSAPKKVLSN